MLSITLLVLLSQDPAVTVTAPPTMTEPRVMGGVLAPAALPAGTNALYGFVGAPELGAGYRQGFGGVMELEARALFNLFQVSGLAEVGVKFCACRHERLTLAGGLALGLQFDSGARYIDSKNFAFVGLRPRLSAAMSYELTSLISVVGTAELPLALSFSQGFELTPLLGAGVEFQLGGPFSLLVAGAGGLDAMREPLGVTQYRGAWNARLGIGYRMF
ncbi:MAG: hypothetical protein U0228_12445 [Myxococcaceae bacterium]